MEEAGGAAVWSRTRGALKLEGFFLNEPPAVFHSADLCELCVCSLRMLLCLSRAGGILKGGSANISGGSNATLRQTRRDGKSRANSAPASGALGHPGDAQVHAGAQLYSLRTNRVTTVNPNDRFSICERHAYVFSEAPGPR